MFRRLPPIRPRWSRVEAQRHSRAQMRRLNTLQLMSDMAHNRTRAAATEESERRSNAVQKRQVAEPLPSKKAKIAEFDSIDRRESSKCAQRAGRASSDEESDEVDFNISAFESWASLNAGASLSREASPMSALPLSLPFPLSPLSVSSQTHSIDNVASQPAAPSEHDSAFAVSALICCSHIF